MRAYCLSIHAAYRCRHSGACCTTGWPIAIDTSRVLELRTRRVRGADTLGASSPRQDDGAVPIDKRQDGSCVFHDVDGDGRCAIHAAAGEALLPVACRNFPRVALRDPRGTFVTLSHYCPTAANLLLSAGDITIVDAPPSIALGGDVEGLDATAVLPPLLRAGMLMDLEGYAAWEREGLAVLNSRRLDAETALAIITSATHEACRWSPGRESLATWIAGAFARARDRRNSDSPSSPPPLDHARKAFLAAHLFASWAAYQHGGLAAVVDSLAVALSLVSRHSDPSAFVAAVRAADLQLRHTGDHVRSRSIPALRHG
jgi:Fe-S-cluster containining protein